MAEQASAPRILVSMATYNERDNIEPLVREIHALLPDAHVLITDDSSPDGTGELADKLAQSDSRNHVRHRPGKQGLGTAILSAMHYAMEHGYDYFINMDADFSHHPRYLPAMIAAMASADLVIGSRYMPGGGVANWPASRLWMSKGINGLVRLLLRLPASDTSGGLRCYRVSILRKTNLDRMLSKGYSFQQEVLFRCCRAGCRVIETPILFENRRAGASKVSLHEVARSLGTILRLGLRAALGQD